MPSQKLWKSPRVVPSLAYDDVPKAIEWLARAFGFVERADARLTGDGFCLAWMEIGDGLIGLGTSGGHGNRSPRSDGRMSQTVKVYVDDVDAHHARAKAAGAEIVEEPADRFWGGRIYRARDHEGHLWEFSQIDRELDASLWKLPPGIRRGATRSSER
jgi:uncharacterized glyoxalase superfamily protein PhnB